MIKMFVAKEFVSVRDAANWIDSVTDNMTEEEYFGDSIKGGNGQYVAEVQYYPRSLDAAKSLLEDLREPDLFDPIGGL